MPRLWTKRKSKRAAFILALFYVLAGLSTEYHLPLEGIHIPNIGKAWKSHATLTLLAKQDLPTLGHNMIDPLKSWCWGSILFYPFKNSRFS